MLHIVSTMFFKLTCYFFWYWFWMKVKSRKLFGHDFVLDYDEAGANPRHTKKPGKGP